jgi:hypothetical protein
MAAKQMSRWQRRPLFSKHQPCQPLRRHSARRKIVLPIENTVLAAAPLERLRPRADGVSVHLRGGFSFAQ